MLNPRDYPELNQLFGCYLNQDFDIWGETLPEIIACYREDSGTPACERELAIEIDTFCSRHAANLEDAYRASFRNDFDPALWGLTIPEFFEELKRVLKRPLKRCGRGRCRTDRSNG